MNALTMDTAKRAVSSDNECTMQGWVEYIATSGAYELHVSVHPDDDIANRVYAFCHDEQEMIVIAGHLFDFEPV